MDDKYAAQLKVEYHAAIDRAVVEGRITAEQATKAHADLDAETPVLP